MTPELAKKIADFSTKIMDAIADVPMPPRMSEALKNLASAIDQNPQAGDHGTAMVHRLFSDQIVLKIISPLCSGAVASSGLLPNTPTAVASDLINVVANGVRDQTKYSSFAMREELQRVGPGILQKQEQLFQSIGMPPTSVQTWESPKSFEIGKIIDERVKSFKESEEVKQLELEHHKDAETRKLAGDQKSIFSSPDGDQAVVKKMGAALISFMSKFEDLEINDGMKNEMIENINKDKNKPFNANRSERMQYQNAVINHFFNEMEHQCGEGMNAAKGLVLMNNRPQGSEVEKQYNGSSEFTKNYMEEVNPQILKIVDNLLELNGLPPKI